MPLTIHSVSDTFVLLVILHILKMNCLMLLSDTYSETDLTCKRNRKTQHITNKKTHMTCSGSCHTMPCIPFSFLSTQSSVLLNFSKLNNEVLDM